MADLESRREIKEPELAYGCKRTGVRSNSGDEGSKCKRAELNRRRSSLPAGRGHIRTSGLSPCGERGHVRVWSEVPRSGA